MTKKNEPTPLMKQFFAIKKEYPNTILLFQVGDFYEMFFDDAKTAAATLGIALTARGKNKGEPIPLCGVPLHALDRYLVKLVKAGHNVAVCDQLSEAKPGTVVDRGVTRVMTPGTLTDTNLLDAKSASYLFSFFPMKDSWGLLFGELLTAQLFATVLPASSDKKLESELVRFLPDEILVPHTKTGKSFQSFFKKRGYFTSFVEPNAEKREEVSAWVTKQFRPQVAQKFNEQEALQEAVTSFYLYLQKNQEAALEQFKHFHFYQPDDFLMLDAATQRNLELVKNNQEGTRASTLFSVMDKATTAMGSRMIKKWLLRPLVKKETIVQRQDGIADFMHDVIGTQKLEEQLRTIGDVERVVGRIALSRAQVHDYLSLSRALKELPNLQHILRQKEYVLLLKLISSNIVDFSALQQLLDTAISDDTQKDWLIKQGFDVELDRLRELVHNSNKKILELEQREQQATGIDSLKIRYNQVHGYYIEVTKLKAILVPEDRYTRQQTLVNRERFTTPELRELQHEIVRAKNEISAVEKKVFERVKLEVATYIGRLRKLAHALAHLDAILGFSKVAYDNGYIRPTFHDGRDILITDGRHPVVEQMQGSSFIPNNTTLTDEESLWIITGPNMGGKSTYLRQVALMSIMAQCGSFVPAVSAQLPLLDRIFTRIGAGDNLAEGKSTFLVEMEETATICSQATEKSLVILDEVGRGTSTFDGLAIAQAVVEHIYINVRSRCLFATHYHELTHLQDTFPGIVSYYAASKKTEAGIIFLYKMIKGVADGSFGVEVAKIAQLPGGVVERAQVILEKLTITQSIPASSSDAEIVAEIERLRQENNSFKQSVVRLQEQLSRLENRLSRLDDIDYDDLSPKKAFDVLWELKG